MPLIAKVTIHHGTDKGNNQPSLVIKAGDPIPTGFPKAECDRLMDKGFIVEAGSDAALAPLLGDTTAPVVPANTTE